MEHPSQPNSQAPRIPEKTLRRLPGYYRYFRDLHATGAQSVSCALVGRDLSIDPTLVRKDLEAISAVGRRRVGFVLADLISGIEKHLGYGGVNRAFVMGAGSMGTALLGYKKFREYGLQIVAVFDAAPSRVGERVHELEVQPLERLPELAREWDPQIGIVTVPADRAQEAVDLLVANGIHAIWNFAPVRLHVPPDVIVQSEDLYRSLATLSYKLVMRQQQGGAMAPPPMEAEASVDCPM